MTEAIPILSICCILRGNKSKRTKCHESLHKKSTKSLQYYPQFNRITLIRFSNCTAKKRAKLNPIYVP